MSYYDCLLSIIIYFILIKIELQLQITSLTEEKKVGYIYLYNFVFQDTYIGKTVFKTRQ